jgi:hypothetical protein
LHAAFSDSAAPPDAGILELQLIEIGYYLQLKEAEHPMKSALRIAQSGLILTILMVSTGCVVEPREAYYDHDHNRYYHDHGWHDCVDRDEHCH